MVDVAHRGYVALAGLSTSTRSSLLPFSFNEYTLALSGPEALFTEWLVQIADQFENKMKGPVFLGVPFSATLLDLFVRSSSRVLTLTGLSEPLRVPRYSCTPVFFSLSQGEERARIPAEFRARSFEPVTGWRQ